METQVLTQTDKFSAPAPSDPEDDFSGQVSGMRHKCGVFGIFGHPNAAVITALGLHALQHRGQEAAGIASYDAEDNKFHTERHLGLVGDNFGEDKGAIQRLAGQSAIGHNRYSTSGRVALRNIQPIFADLKTGGFAVAHNGNLTNARYLRQKLVDDGSIFQSTMDTEVILQLIARSMHDKVVERFIDAVRQIEGGFALVGLTNKKLIGARDPWGLRPLVLGELDGAPVLASETCALDAVGATFIRDIENGEVVVITKSGIESYMPFPPRNSTPCVFEYLYFARPDSIMNGKSIYNVREELGRQLAKEHNVEADLVCPVPDGGNPAGLGYAEESSLPFKFGIIRNHYVGRTFIQPDQTSRQSSVSKKHAANRSQLEGKRVVLVDDSIVRGNTSRKIVQMVKAAGAAEVHFRVASPPIKNPDYYGIDMPDTEHLLASRMSIEEMREYLGVDSLGFLSLEGFYRALGVKERNPDAPQYADHCFTADYPTRLVDRDLDAQNGEEQLSLLED